MAPGEKGWHGPLTGAVAGAGRGWEGVLVARIDILRPFWGLVGQRPIGGGKGRPGGK